MRTLDIGHEMHQFMIKAFPICRSLTGDGVRETLALISDVLPLVIYEVPSGTQAFDWVVPKEWSIRDAYIEDESGNRIVDFKQNNLHVVGYSTPVDEWLTLEELQMHLHSLPEQPDAIPYVTSYYKERWGFCISNAQRLKLKDKKYHVYIDSTLEDGNLTYGECIIKGKTEQEIFLSTYICHPSMANNELSGPAVAAFIGRWIASQSMQYTYRLVFIPETIGAIVYLSRHLDELKRKCIAGFNLSCIGDNNGYSYVASRYGKSLADRVAANVLRFNFCDYIEYSFLDRGSDERQYCSPGVDLPLVTLCRSKYGTYPEYHTSLDNLDFVTPEGLYGGYQLVENCINVIENNKTYKVACYGEPQLGKRGLYPNLSTKTSKKSVDIMMDFIAYSDGSNDLIEISNIIGQPVSKIIPIAKQLVDAELLVEIL